MKTLLTTLIAIAMLGAIAHPASAASVKVASVPQEEEHPIHWSVFFKNPYPTQDQFYQLSEGYETIQQADNPLADFVLLPQTPDLQVELIRF